MNKVKIVAWLGPPASGKGTYTKLIGQMLPQPAVKVVMSDVIREEISKNTKAGMKMKPFMDRFEEHVPSDLVASALKRKLLSLTDASSSRVPSVIFLDGFPRTVSQTELFLPFSSNFDISCIHLQLRRSWASIKSNGRLVCLKCDYSYNDATINEDGVLWADDMPAKPKCSLTIGCGFDRLERRADMVNFNRRYDTYEETEMRALELLKSKVPSRTIDIEGGYERMTPTIGTAAFELLGLDVKHLWRSLNVPPTAADPSYLPP
eukprot:GEMP01052711.1.p1 GENE.GEMP01052711.1~~GEMP01052711.1.p1  ORF type:complete len:263 (+),score=36.24 GEMP01052711.1:35-823(+)